MTHEQIKQPFEAAAAGQPTPPQPAGAASEGATTDAARPREAAALWRALAGMVLSLALACVIVAFEFSTQATHRANRLRTRLKALTLKVHKLEAQIGAQRARLAAARRELGAAETLRAVLLAPDATTIRLIPAHGADDVSAGAAAAPAPAATDAAEGGEASPARLAEAPPASGAPAAATDAPHGGAGRGVQRAAGAPHPRALLAFSLKEGRAVLQVVGLQRPARDGTLVLWWRGARGALRRAGEFRTAADGGAMVALKLPRNFSPTGATITAEGAQAGGASPQADVLLRGALGHNR
jgi:hypothetical protein